MKRSIYFLFFSMLLPNLTIADTVRNKTITEVFVNQGSLIAFKYEPVDNINNPNNCNTNYIELNKDAAFFKEQYSLLLTLMASGKKTDIHIGTNCGRYHIQAHWFNVRN